MKATLPELKLVSVRYNVADAIREALIGGSFQPGESLSELQIAAQLKVSRGPVREALLMLAQEGLLTHSHNRGFSVLHFAKEDRDKIRCVRRPLEVLALSLAQSNITPAEIATAQAHLDSLLSSLREGKHQDAVRADFEFHFVIYEASRNEWLIAALKRIMVPYFTYAMVYIGRDPSLTEEVAAKQHALYLDYLTGNTGLTADQCVDPHFGRSSASVAQRLSGPPATAVSDSGGSAME